MHHQNNGLEGCHPPPYAFLLPKKRKEHFVQLLNKSHDSLIRSCEVLCNGLKEFSSKLI